MNTGITSRTGLFYSRVIAIVDDYCRISAFFDTYLATDRFLDLRLAFDRKFVDFQRFSDVKVLDFLIWQMRTPASLQAIA